MYPPKNHRINFHKIHNKMDKIFDGNKWMHNTPSLSTREEKGLHWDSPLEVLRKMWRESEEFRSYLQNQVHLRQNWATGPSNGHLIGLRLKKNSCTKLDVGCSEQVRQKIKVFPILIIKTTQWTLNSEKCGKIDENWYAGTQDGRPAIWSKFDDNECNCNIRTPD